MPQDKKKPSQAKSTSKAGETARPKLSILSLESRLMFDAAGATTAAEVNQEQVAQEQAETAVSGDSSSETQESTASQDLLQGLTTYLPVESRQEIVFVDPTVPNYQDLLSGMDPTIEVVMLDGSYDGIEQMASALAGRTDIDAIHVISHGDAGTLQLGTGTLTIDSMAGEYADELTAIKGALSEQADFLVYGCDFAEGDRGQAAVTQLAALTGADVQASSDLTGNVDFGGDWDLEFRIGTIETQIVVSDEAQINWKGLLAETWMDAATGTVIGGPVGNDWYVGDSANNTPVSSAGGTDIMYGAGGDDTLTSGSGNDILVGGTGNDTISGGSDDDVILGGTGNDYLDGGSAVGKNTIIGGGGNDQMVGGSGTDVFRFTGAQSGDVYTVNGGGATDIIDLSEFSTATITNSGGVITVDRGGGDVFTINHSNVETVITAATVGNHGPLAEAGADQSVYTNSAVTLSATSSSDQDGNTLTYQWTQIEGTKVTLSSSTAASPTFTAPSSATTLQFIVVVSDGTTSHADTVTITVTAAGLTASGGETRINTTTTGTQTHNSLLDYYTPDSVAMDASGNYVSVWESAGNIYGQRYNSAGTAQGSEFIIASNAANERLASVDMNASGAFVVTWERDQGTGDYDIYARLYNSSGTAITSEFLVNDTTTYDQEHAHVGMAADGSFVVVFESNIEASGTYYDNVYAQRYDATGARIGSNFMVNTTTGGDQDSADIAMDAAGNFIVVWEGERTAGTSAYSIYGQRYNASGVAQGSEFLVNSVASSNDQRASVAMNDSGNFVVTWDSLSSGNADIQAQRFNSSGVAQGSMVSVTSSASYEQEMANVAMDGSGNFVVSWMSNGQDGSGWGVYARQYDSTGTAMMTESRVSTTTTGRQDYPGVAYEDGKVVITWSGNGTGDTAGIFMQRYTATGGNAAPTITSNGGGVTASISVAENVTAVTTVTATDADVGATLTYSISGGADAAKFTINSSTGVLSFISAPNYESPTDSGGNNVYDVLVTVKDNNGGADTQSIAVTVTNTNDAPVLADTALSITVAEDAGAPSGAVGSLVSAFTGGITDQDSGASKGIAITGSNETNGTWYYTTNGGTTWTAIGSVSNSSALLLADNANTRLYFSPGANYNGTSTGALTLRAWDQTSGSAGSKVTTASNGGTTAFSSATDTVDVTVTAVNDAPVLADTALSITVAEDAGAPSGAVGSALSAFTGGITDVDASAVKGIAITGSNETNGTWYYTTNGGTTWTAVGTVSNISALLLADNANTRLYFSPSGNYNGTSTAALTVRAWDQTSGTAGTKVTTASNGGTTAFSSATDTVDVTVTAVNDAPVLADTALSITVAEDAGAPSGAVGSTVSAFTGGITDVDSGASKGIAITGSNETNGTWYYTTNGGTTWTAVGSVSNTSALLLADNGSTRLYFSPSANYNGTSTAALTMRAWDQTSGTAGTKVSTASNGGTTAFSSATDTVNVSVTAVNDTPTDLALSSNTV
uniref:DUF4347 domain-containing protein n=1 Tax=Nitrospira sp. BLG_1 TaxID=3395883 RepID=UPI0039BC7043